MAANDDRGGKGDEFWALLQTDQAKRAVEAAERGTLTVGVNPGDHDEITPHLYIAADPAQQKKTPREMTAEAEARRQALAERAAD